jgi:hypothetical protein
MRKDLRDVAKNTKNKALFGIGDQYRDILLK